MPQPEAGRSHGGRPAVGGRKGPAVGGPRLIAEVVVTIAIRSSDDPMGFPRRVSVAALGIYLLLRMCQEVLKALIVGRRSAAKKNGEPMADDVLASRWQRDRQKVREGAAVAAASRWQPGPVPQPRPPASS